MFEGPEIASYVVKLAEKCVLQAAQYTNLFTRASGLATLLLDVRKSSWQ